MDSVLRWAGGKSWFVRYFRRLFADDPLFEERRLVELFSGSAALSFGLEHKKVHLNDSNPGLINFLEHLQTGLTVPPVDGIDKERYEGIRSAYNESRGSSSLQQAIRFYILNKTGYNGLWRENKSGAHNVPWSKKTSVPMLPTNTKRMQLMENWTFSCGDYSAVELQPDDIVFADPPYADTFSNYTKDLWNWDVHVKLAAYLSELPRVVVTNSLSNRTVRLYQELGFELRTVTPPRRISCTGNREPVNELLAYKIPLVTRLPSPVESNDDWS